MNIPFRVDPEFYIFPYLRNHGLVPYTQIIDQHFPGGFFLPLNFANLGFTTPEAFQSLLIFIIFLISLLIFKITKKFSTILLFLVLWPFFDGGHLWIDTFISLSLLSSYYFFINKKYYLTSLSLTFGLLFKQTVLLPIFLLSFISPQILIFPAALLLIFYFYFSKDFWYWTFIFNFTAYAGKAISIFNFPKLLLIFLPTVLHIKKYPWLFIFLLFSLLGFFARPDLVHLQPAAPFLILLFYYFLEEYLPFKKFSYTIIISLLLIILLKKTNFNQKYYPYFDPNTLSLVSKIQDLTSKNDEIFLLGAQPHIYTFSNTLPAGKYFAYQLPWYLKITETQSLNNLITSNPKIIVYDTSAVVDDIPITSYAPKLVNYLLSNYQLTNSIGNYQIYLKNTY